MDNAKLDSNWVKVALKVNQITQLTKLDVNLGVEHILRQICEENGIRYEAGKYALKVQDFCRFIGTEYVTEENKTELKHGNQMKLSKSPARKVSKLIDCLHKSTDQETSLRHLNNLALASKDSVMLREMHKQNVVQHLRVFASVRELSPDECHKQYRVIGQLLTENYVSGLNQDEIEYLMSVIIHNGKTTREMLLLSFELLILLRKKGKLYWPMKLLRKLLPYVRLYEDRKLQERSLHLINYLYLFADGSEERKTICDFMKSPIMITYIVKYVIGEHLTKSIKHQLYLYQKIILRKYNKLLDAVECEEEKILERLEFLISNAGVVSQAREMSDYAQAQERERKLEEEMRDEDKDQQILCNLRASLTPARRHSNSAGRDEKKFKDRLRCQESWDGSENDFLTKKIHFKRQKSATSTDANVSEEELQGIHDVPKDVETEKSIETMEEGVSALARNSLYYYVMNDFKNFEKLLIVHKNHLKSILRLGAGITNLLCKIFEIQKEEPEIKRGRFVPLCFLYYDQIVERLFGIAIKLFHKTRQEMDVAIDSSEYPIVLKTVEYKLLAGLEAEPVEFQELEIRLNEFSLDVVLKRREEAIREDIERQLTCHPGFIELKKIITPGIMEKIQEKRLRFMKTGEHVPQFDYKGQKMGDKMWFIYLPNTQDRILIEECSRDSCKNNHKTLHSVSICDIREVECGIKSNFYKEVYFNLQVHIQFILICSTERDMFFRSGTKLQEPAFQFPISLKLQSLSYVDFCAGSELTMNYWVDGINFLIGQKMSTETTTQEFNYLLDIQLMLHLAELEGLKIPEKPPEVPPPPTNYDFALP